MSLSSKFTSPATKLTAPLDKRAVSRGYQGNGSHDSHDANGHAKGWIDGYSSVLLRTDQKDAIRDFKEAMGMNLPGFERSLVTAMVKMLLDRKDLRPELLKGLEDAMRRDSELQISQLQRHYKAVPDGRSSGPGGSK